MIPSSHDRAKQICFDSDPQGTPKIQRNKALSSPWLILDMGGGSSMVLLCLMMVVMSILVPSSAQSSCQSFTFTNRRSFQLCQPLTRLGSSLHWTYNPTLGTADVAYRAPQSAGGWVAWGLNPSRTMMIGTQAIVALQASNGSMTVFTTPITDRNPTMRQTPISFKAENLSGEYSVGVMTIFATITLPNNKTTFSHVWQESTVVSNGVPGPHPTSGDNVQSYGTIDFLSGGASAASGGNSILHRKNTHGVINAISWGILMPVGAIIARYLRVFKSADPAWFYLHVTCQCSAYVLGVSGWGLGLKLGSDSVGITYHRHRYIGIALFCLATLQVFALFVRPHVDNKHRIVWNVYHHTVGYTVIVLSVVNIYKGFNILEPADKWKNAYTGIIVALAVVAVILEVVTWIVVLSRKARRRSEEKGQQDANRFDGARL